MVDNFVDVGQDEINQFVSKTLFILGDFPAVSQTFIHRELVEMERLGAKVQLLAVREIPRPGLSGALEHIRGRAVFLSRRRLWPCQGLLQGAKSPHRLLCLAKDIVRLPHRSLYHRLRGLSALTVAWHVAQELKERGIQYIHAHFGAYQSEIAYCLSALTGLPYGTTFHAYGIWRDRNLIRQKIENARVVLTCTRYNRLHLAQVAPGSAHKVHLVYHGVDLDSLGRPTPMMDDGVPLWVAVGRMVPKKGFVHILEAASLLRSSGEAFRLVLVGGGEEEADLRRRISSLGLQECVEMRGAMDNAEVLKIMRRSRGLVMPSVQDHAGDIDGLPNVVLESLALARPVVGSCLSGIPEAVIQGKTGRLVPPGNPRALAEAITSLNRDKSLAVEMGKRGRRLVEERFDVRKNTRQQMRLLTQTKSGRCRSPVEPLFAMAR